MNKQILFLILLLLPVLTFGQMKKATEDGYTYEYAENDALKARIYTLDNGLKIYLSDYEEEPRIQTYIAVRAGSKHDPADNTGLAHYLEHMMFKGTDEIGAMNWEKEKVLLKQISDLYEKHKYSEDDEERKQIYAQIDSISLQASNLCIANEYDKMISSIGANGTNAYTWVEQTVYVNEIPSNELQKWLQLESERFSQLVLRLFHTELEAVYEEFNRAQDNDFRKVLYTLYEELFKNHQYGTQTTIGEGEHLKNPSMERIHEYFNKYYVPNNVAIVLSGDIDYTETIMLVEKYFGDWNRKEVPKYIPPKEEPIIGPIVREVRGTQAENVTIGWRLDAGAGSLEAKKMELMDMLLMNGEAGLIDLNLNQAQKVLRASSGPTIFEDYGVFTLQATPRQGQSLEEARDLLFEQIEKIKKGEFEDWIMQGAISDLRLRQTKSFERNSGRASSMVEAFIQGQEWSELVNYFDEMEKLTKEDIVAFANDFFKEDNYVIIYKKMDVEQELHKVEKPKISEVSLNRDKQSDFHKNFVSLQSEAIQPKFVDFNASISKHQLKSGVELSYIPNTVNNTFNLNYILDMGRDHDKVMSLAVNYLPYLGTDKYPASELNKQFYKLGLSFNVNVGNDRVYVSLSGLEENMEKGIELFEHILSNVKADDEAYDNLVEGILKSREDAKLNKGRILQGAMLNYALHGENSAFRNILSEAELKEMDPQQLVDKIKQINSFKHRIFYYGAKSAEEAKLALDMHHKVPMPLKDYPEKAKYDDLPTDKPKVYFVEYDMVQAEILLVARGNKYDADLQPAINLYNTYFGSGLSSIVFQEIRESRALAYSAFSRFITPGEKDEDFINFAYVGTQADKMPDAINAMKEILDEMPVSKDQFEAAKASIMKKIETDRITQSSIFWTYEGLKKRGLNHDARKDVYDFANQATIDHIVKFQNENIKPCSYVYLVIGKKENIDMEALEKLGPVEELSLKTIFNY